jgi:hypothetical protein
MLKTKHLSPLSTILAHLPNRVWALDVVVGPFSVDGDPVVGLKVVGVEPPVAAEDSSALKLVEVVTIVALILGVVVAVAVDVVSDGRIGISHSVTVMHPSSSSRSGRCWKRLISTDLPN